jgi:hypothetical protein
MVSFRLSSSEYENFCELCFTHGVRSFSELARVGLNLLLEKSSDPSQGELEVRVGIVEARLRTLALKVEAFSKHLAKDGCSKVQERETS